MAEILAKAKAEATKEAGKWITERLRSRTRDGKGVKSPGAPTSALKPLSPKYIKQRKRMQLSSETSPSTSNLTQTGSMLDSLYYKIEGLRLTFGVRGVKNTLKAMYTSVERPWASLSKGEVTELIAYLKRFLPK